MGRVGEGATRADELERLGYSRSHALYRALEERCQALEEENKRLRGYVSVIASGMPREDLLAIEREFTDAD